MSKAAPTDKKKVTLFKFVIMAVIMLAVAYKVYADNYSKDNKFSSGRVKFISQDIEIKVKVASTVAERNQGLMNVKEMPMNEGMLFDFDVERRQHFWMKDTYIPLDMIFIGSDMKVRNTYENAIPHNEEQISSIVPVRYVVEVNAGFVKLNDIKSGDRVEITR
jgi:uncharacterized membrane protein (UPF0127 family)